jgi:signal transduction histidine kinase
VGTADLLDTFTGLLAGLDEQESPEAFYGRLCEATCRLGRMDRAVIFLYDETRRRVRATGAHGVELERFADAQVTVESAPIARRALAEDRVVEAAGAEQRDAVPAAYADLVARSRLVCAPMIAAGAWLGVILCDRGDNGVPLSDEERHGLWTLAKVAALATQAQVATAAVERARTLQGRVELARDVHDAVIQRLFGVSLALAAEAPLDSAAQQRAGEEVQEALAELRLLLGRPLEPAPASGVELGEEAARLGVALEGDAPVPEGRERLALSVLAEAARNARRHAEPTRIDARVEHVNGVWAMEVRNDGVHGARRGRPGMGLRLAALEALQAGGLVEFGPAGEGEWRVRLAVPVD